MQRLFSTFPGGWPGAGMLLLRLSVAAPVLVHGIVKIHAAPQSLSLLWTDATVLSGILILAGLWTPFAASSQMLLQLWIAFSRGGLNEAAILLAAMSACAAMLGPGAWSIDSRLFGRRRIIFPGR